MFQCHIEFGLCRDHIQLFNINSAHETKKYIYLYIQYFFKFHIFLNVQNHFGKKQKTFFFKATRHIFTFWARLLTDGVVFHRARALRHSFANSPLNSPIYQKLSTQVFCFLIKNTEIYSHI